MVKLVLIFEDNDPEMGTYFSECATHVKGVLNGINADVHEINGENLNSEHIDLTIKSFEGNKFLCLVYSHGDKVSFGSKKTFIAKGEIDNFSNSFFYTFSCHTGADIGKDLVSNGCITFWGYVSEASYVVGYLPIFVECANCGILKMIQGEATITAYHSMKENYNAQIDIMYTSNFFTASVLLGNRDGMVLHGNQELKLDDFIIV
jgi:hypothetical protein